MKTRLRFIFYTNEKTFSLGLMFRLLVIYFVRSFGIDHKISLQTDNGEEFGGKSVDKLEYLKKKVFSPSQRGAFSSTQGEEGVSGLRGTLASER